MPNKYTVYDGFNSYELTGEQYLYTLLQWAKEGDFESVASSLFDNQDALDAFHEKDMESWVNMND